MAQSAHSNEPDSSQSPPPSIKEFAEHFPDYQIEELIGQGGMGCVFKAMQKNLQRPVAIKILSSEISQDPELGERFLREARTLATLNHAGILTVYDYGERNGTFFLVTELVDGVNLRQLMELGELSPAEALRIAPQLCTALQFAHERGVVHRDIKPENILIDTDGQVKIADFGLAKVARPGDELALTRDTAVLGTPHYMAPEQWQGARTVDHRADIYSLGVVIYEMLTGNLPLGNFDPPSRRGGVPQGLDAVVRRALAQQPENRYQHASEVQSDVEQQSDKLKHSGEQTATHANGARKPGASIVKGPFVAVALLLVAAATIGYLIYDFEFSQIQRKHFSDSVDQYRELTNQWVAAANDTRSGFEQVDYAYEAIPQLPTPAAAPIFDSLQITLASLCVGAGCILLTLALGFHSIRQIRNSSGKKTGLYVAVITAWIAPIIAAATLLYLPLNLIRGDLYTVLGTAWFGGVAYGAWHFVSREVARHRVLIEQGTSMAGSVWIRVALTLAIAAFGNVAAIPGYLPSRITDQEITPGATMAKQLVGKTRASVIAYLGPPLAISVSQSSEAWAYNNEAGVLVENALQFGGDQMISVASNVHVLLGNRPSSSNPQIGQPVEAFLDHYGSPTSEVHGALTDEITFSNGIQITVRNGIVVGM